MSKKSLFAVFCDESSAEPSKASASRKGSSQPGAPSIRSKSTTQNKQVLGNKENAPLRAKTAALGHPAKVFAGKAPFEAASPIAASRTAEHKSQALGFYAPGHLHTKPKSKTAGGGFTLSSKPERCGLRAGDPVKPSTAKAFALSQPRGQVDGSAAVTHQHGALFSQLLPDAPQTPKAAPVSPVLANISEAFSGQNGFHFSPAATQSDEAHVGPLDTPQGPVFVLPDATDPAFADNPQTPVVVLSGSPVKKRRAPQPLLEKRMRALRL